MFNFLLFFLVFGGIRVPCKSLLIERDDHLRTLHVGLLRRHQVSFIGVFPAKINTKTSLTDCFFHITLNLNAFTVIEESESWEHSGPFQISNCYTNHLELSGFVGMFTMETCETTKLFSRSQGELLIHKWSFWVLSILLMTHLVDQTNQAVTNVQQLRCTQTISWGTWVLLWSLWHQ